MAALSANRPVPNTLQQRLDLAGGVVVDMIMTASQTIYEGSFVGFTAGTGTVRALVSGDVFAGVALKKAVSAASGTTTVPVYINGFLTHTVASGASSSVGKVCFATDDNTIDLTSTTASAVGRVVNFNVDGKCTIKMKTVGEGSGQSNAATIIFTANAQ